MIHLEMNLLNTIYINLHQYIGVNNLYDSNFTISLYEGRRPFGNLKNQLEMFSIELKESKEEMLLIIIKNLIFCMF